MILASAPPHLTAIALLVALSYAWLAFRAVAMPPILRRTWFVLAWLAHGALLAAGLGMAAGLGLDKGAVYFGFGPALSFTAWIAAGIFAAEAWLYPHRQERWFLGAIAAMAVLLALDFPGHPLANNGAQWLAVHLAMGIASYGLFGVAVVHAWFSRRAEVRIRNATHAYDGMPLLTMERLTYRFIYAGFFLLSATLLGAYFFADLWSSNGHGWRWDHKTIFALLSWLTFATLLIGRRMLGWRGVRATQVLYLGTAFLVLSYIGSHFVLEVVLGRFL